MTSAVASTRWAAVKPVYHHIYGHIHGYNADRQPPCLWSCPWLHCSCRLPACVPTVMSMAALLMQTFYLCVCGHIHGYITHADFLPSRLWSCPWLHCSCSLSKVMCLVMFMATLHMRTFYHYVCGHVYDYTRISEFLEYRTTGIPSDTF